MTSLSTSSLMVALVQSATTFPIVLLALPSGALADIVDRRRYLMIAEVWMLLAAAGLGFCTLSGITTDWLLLAFTFMLGCGTAMSLSAWAAIAPELVPKTELHAAITLNGPGMNISRAIGPALTGLVIAAFGPASVFLLNAVSFLGVLAVLIAWNRDYRTSSLPAERLLGDPFRLTLCPAFPDAAIGIDQGRCIFPVCKRFMGITAILVRKQLLAGPSTYSVLLMYRYRSRCSPQRLSFTAPASIPR